MTKNEMYEGFTPLQIQIIEAKLDGESSRSIANRLLGSKTKKSTVNNIYNRYLAQANISPPVEVSAIEADYDADLDTLVANPDFSVSNLAKRLRAAQKANTQLRKIQREVFDSEVGTDSFLTALEGVVSRLNVKADHVQRRFALPSGKPLQSATMEILFSDMQIGKLCADYDTEVAKQRMCKFVNGIIELLQHPKYQFERVILASLGDIVEDNMKHGVGSANACDTGLSEQMADAIELIWSELITVLAATGIKVDVMCIAGNHGSSAHKGMDVYKAGRYAYDYPIYKSLELLAKAAKLDNVNFIIPEGVFGYLNIYGNYVIYEHGYFNQASEKGMNDQMKKRGQQIKKHVEYYRQGDKHNVQAFDCGKIVLNGAFFGNDVNATEYSGVLGFSAIPAQVVMIHTPEEKLGRNTIKEFHAIQLA